MTMFNQLEEIFLISPLWLISWSRLYFLDLFPTVIVLYVDDVVR